MSLQRVINVSFALALFFGVLALPCILIMDWNAWPLAITGGLALLCGAVEILCIAYGFAFD